MAENFTTLVLRLAEDPQALEDFRRDPTNALQDAGLSNAERTLLTSGNAKLIREAITSDIGADQVEGQLAGSIWPITVVIAVTVVITSHETEKETPE